MKLQTQIPLTPGQPQIDYNSKVLLVGSCFVEHMGKKLEYFKFQSLQNPFGIIFNPVSIEKIIERAVKEVHFTEADIFEKDGQWLSFEVHSMMTAGSKETFVRLLNDRLKELKQYIETATHLVFTFGTAWVYEHQASSKIVANCHKIPQKEFTKGLLTVSQISKALTGIQSHIRSVNPKATLISTLSPVRHLKDGFVENSRSKAHLLVALHEVEGFHYFPSYEIVMDELRDYRFYEKDLLHPNETAVDIIWDRFNKVWISDKVAELQNEIDTIQKGLHHRPFNPNSTTHIAFRENLQKQIEKLQHLLPRVKF